MNRNMRRETGLIVALLLLWLIPIRAQEPQGKETPPEEKAWLQRLARLEDLVRRLQREIDYERRPDARQIHSSDESLEVRLVRLESNVSLLMDRLTSSPAAAPTSPSQQTPIILTPASAPVPVTGSATQPVDASINDPEHLPFAGYMEMHFNKRVGDPSRLDFHRFVLLFGHSFSSRIRFWSEFELEHVFVEGREEKGELELEQGYLDFFLSPYINLRGGMLLAPVGILNERHEPPAFFGVERPQVDTVIIPSTWFDAGAGIWGDLGKGFSYRAYVMAPLDASEFSAGEGLRGGRQKGFKSDFRHAAKTLRVEYRGIPKLVLGTSYWTGDSGFNVARLRVPVRVFDVDGRFRYRLFDARGQYSHNWVGNARELNRALTQRLGSNPNIAEQMRGFYLEGGVHLLPRRIDSDLAVFLRYENYDTQFRMPRGYLPLRQYDRSNWTVGMNYFPHPDVVLKLDYIFNQNRSRAVKARNQFNIGLGWWF